MERIFTLRSLFVCKEVRNLAQPQTPPDMNREKAGDYRVIFVSGVFGGPRPDHFDLVVQTASINTGESQEKNKSVVDVKDQVCLKLTPEQAKSLHNWLGNNIDKYEDQFREIGEAETEEIETGREFG